MKLVSVVKESIAPGRCNNVITFYAVRLDYFLLKAEKMCKLYIFFQLCTFNFTSTLGYTFLSLLPKWIDSVTSFTIRTSSHFFMFDLIGTRVNPTRRPVV